jgi:hypothetical protein
MILFILIAVFSFLIQFFLPWWGMVAVALILGFLMGTRSVQSFLSGFFACGLVWLFMAFYIHFTRGDLMTNRIAELLSLHGTMILYAGVFFVAALAGGLSSLSGYFLREIYDYKNVSRRKM